jgi:diguanylate cyclase (GGDEF)-like protein
MRSSGGLTTQLRQIRPRARAVSAVRADDLKELSAKAVDWMRRWWRQPDHYAWLSAYLAARNLQRSTRLLMAGIVLALGFVPLLILLSSVGADDLRFRVVALAVITCCAVMAVLWLTRWPTRGQSVMFALAGNACIAACSLTQSRPESGLQIATVFVALAAYVAFFHTSRILALTLLMATASATILAIQISGYVGVALTLSKLVVLFVSILAVPISAQVLVRILGTDAIKSDTDPLTDLPNRRAFDRSVRALAAESIGNGSAVLAIVMVDLDAFKRVNDTAGHAAGDQTLIAIAGILRRTRRSDSVTARIGGEEFVVAVVGAEQAAIGMAERLRREIAETSWNVTASVGVATASLARVPKNGIRTLVQDLVESADRAMYRAKRAGGDQVNVAGHPEQTYVDKPTASSMTATNGNAPWTTAERALSGDDATRTIAAASIDPTPAKTKAAPTGVPPEITNPTPTPVTMARKRL